MGCQTPFFVSKLPRGSRNAITDVPGVTVGHCTLDRGEVQTGVTAVLPHGGNLFQEKVPAGHAVFNGFGKTTGLMQLGELGVLETPIVLTNTLSVGTAFTALVKRALSEDPEIGVTAGTVNPVVCECNDSRLSDIARRPVGEKEVFAAIHSASADFAQGAVGAGRGTTCYGMKGGIGSSSRLMELDGKTYTLGVLVQSNYGAAEDFRPASVPPGLAESDQGSIILVLATDLPLSTRQLRRVIRRTSVGMARLGSYIGHGSGEICVGFTTARPAACSDSFLTQTVLREDKMNLPFRAAGECAEEAILQSMWNAGADTALNGKKIPSLREFLKEKRS